jgi:hypothetical protein
VLKIKKHCCWDKLPEPLSISPVLKELCAHLSKSVTVDDTQIATVDLTRLQIGTTGTLFLNVLLIYSSFG